MANFNKVLLLGNLTRDPQLSYLPSQTAVVDFGMAMNRKYKGQDGNMKDEACFVDCRAFGKPAENINKFCKKGNQLFVEGRLTFDSWTTKDGVKHSKHRVTIENFQLLGLPNKTKSDEGEDSLPEELVPSSDGGSSNDIPF
jgi:single-strand DNA-binding protein